MGLDNVGNMVVSAIVGFSWLGALVTWRIHRSKLPLDRETVTVTSAEKLVDAANALMEHLQKRVDTLQAEMERERERTAVVTAKLALLEAELAASKTALSEVAFWLAQQWRAIPASRWVAPISPIPPVLRQYVDPDLLAEIEARGKGTGRE